MINRKVLDKTQAMYAIENGEFGNDVTASKKQVVVVMTQDWCPQWKSMQGWIYNMDVNEDIDVYELIYNRVDFKSEFMSFKENVLGNQEIPYLRIYEDGKFFAETNYISPEKLKNVLVK